jgi:hypothetical protein
MGKTCVATVEKPEEYASGEHNLCTKMYGSSFAWWLQHGLSHSVSRLFSHWFSTPKRSTKTPVLCLVFPAFHCTYNYDYKYQLIIS